MVCGLGLVWAEPDVDVSLSLTFRADVDVGGVSLPGMLGDRVVGNFGMPQRRSNCLETFAAPLNEMVRFSSVQVDGWRCSALPKPCQLR
jgi:hypothetical protein